MRMLPKTATRTMAATARSLILALAALAAAPGIAAANPERDACGRDITSGAWAEPCHADMSVNTGSLELEGVAALAASAAVSPACGTRSPGACDGREDSRR
jgi:hypothetical protein